MVIREKDDKRDDRIEQIGEVKKLGFPYLPALISY